jgi:tetratricopeptide (TPR) repeat protein
MSCLEKLTHCWEKLIRDHPDIPELQNDLAGQYLYLGEAYGGTEGVRFADQAIVLFAKLSQEHPAVPSYRVELARAYDFRGKSLMESGLPREAEAASLTALKLRRELAQAFPEKASHSAWLAANLRTASQLQVARGLPNEAEKSLRQARDIQERLVVQFPSIATYYLDLARTETELGNICKIVGRTQEAEASYKRAEAVHRLAIDSYERLSAVRPKDVALKQELTRRYIDLGVVLNESGQDSKAAEAYAKALAVINTATESTDEEQGRSQLAEMAYGLGQLLLSKRRSAEAAKAFGLAAANCQKLTIANPRNSKFRERMGEAYRMAGHVEQRQQVRAELFRNALKVFESLAADFPNEPQHRRWVAHAQVHMAPVLAADQLQEKEKSYRKCLDVLAELPADFFKDRYVRDDLEFASNGLAHLLKSRGRSQETAAVYDQVIKIWGKAIEIHPERYDAWRERAKVYVSLNLPEKAIADLRQAIAKGLPDAQQVLKYDGTWEPLRSHADFKKLLAELEQRSAQRP